MAKKILVVDDEPDLLKVTLLRLKKTGYEVFGAVDGREALDLARRIIPDLIILDIYLPLINGDEVAKRLKKDDGLKHIPIILISATTRSLAERTKDSGACGYLTKPFEPEELVGVAKKILGKGIKLCKDAYEVARTSDCIIVATEWNEFKELDFKRIKKLMRQPVIVDGRNLYDPSEMKKLGFKYAGMGRR